MVSWFGAISSAKLTTYILRKNSLEFAHSFPQACDAICGQHYMDYYLDSVDSEEEAINLIQSVREVQGRKERPYYVKLTLKFQESCENDTYGYES